MRFMLLIKADMNSEAGVLPSKELLAEMGRFNDEMFKAGIMRAGDGLQPSSKGARVDFEAGGKRTVTDGPFAEAKELIAGFWIIDVASKEEAIEWACRCPDPMGPGETAQIEVRQIFEASDFPEDIFPAEDAAHEVAMQQELQERYGAGS
jgi:hypothetical protein